MIDGEIHSIVKSTQQFDMLIKKFREGQFYFHQKWIVYVEKSYSAVHFAHFLNAIQISSI